MGILVAILSVKHCKFLKTRFEKLGIIDKSYYFKKDDSNSIVSIPVTKGAEKELLPFAEPDFNKFAIEGVKFSLHYDKSDKGYVSRNTLSQSQRLELQVKKLLESQKSNEFEDVLHEIPESWEKYGDMVIFDTRKYFKSDIWKKIGAELWECICNVLQVKRVAFKSCIQSDEFRSPSVQVVWGDSSWAHHVDNGILYDWDIEKSMFCAGNAPERHRIGKLKCSGEVVVDLYAGIGYFTLPYLVHAKAELVHALEWNPNSVKALRINLKQNNVSNRCIVYEGDSTVLCPLDIADRINLGLLPSSEGGWKTACAALRRSTGGVLHIHQNVVTHSHRKHGPGHCDSLNDSSCCECLAMCEECKHIMKKFHDSDIEEGNSHIFKSENSFYLTNNGLPVVNADVQIKWRTPKWKLWALHVCHILYSIFVELYGEDLWKVCVEDLHHVKSYAPHIDHLVLDVRCIPQLRSLPQIS